MPHGNKKSSTNHKKKKASRLPPSVNHNDNSNQSVTHPESASTTHLRARSSTGSSSSQQIPPTIHDFPNWEDPAAFESRHHNNNVLGLSTIYERYKQATDRFKYALEQMVPSSIFADATKVQCLLDAVDYLHAQSQQHQQQQQQLPDNSVEGNTAVHIDVQIMDDLKTAISFRKRVMKSFYRGGDDGHYYFVEVLNYCWVTLKPLAYLSSSSSAAQDRTTSSQPNAHQHQSKNNTDNNNHDPISNRFGALSLEDVLEDSDTVDATVTPAADVPIQRPLPPVKELSLHDLTHGDDYFCAQMFLLSMDEMMQFVAEFYRTMKTSWRTHPQRDIPSNAYVEDIMEASVYVNFAIQQIMMIEEEFSSKYPYLNTVYRMMSFLVYPQWVKEFTDMVGPSVSDLDAFMASHDAVAFFGDIIETGFRNPSDVYSQTEVIVTEFCTKWKVDATLICPEVERWKLFGRFEAPLSIEKASNQSQFQLMASLGIQSHSWLAPFQYIGGRDRCMMNTIRLLQGLSNVVKKGQPLIVKRGMFGRQWDEARKKATKICGDMDELLMGDVLPTLLLMCTDGMLSTQLPRESELLTFFTVLKSFTASPEKAIPWSLAFAVQALLTSFFEMQGQNDIERLGNMAKSSFDLYIDHLHTMIRQRNDAIQGKNWNDNLNRLQTLRWLVYPVHNQGRQVEERAIWNPLCAGLFMEYICFFGNLDSGIAMVDDFAQLRMVLHLFNAFLQVGALEQGQIPFLDWLYETFRNCKAVWEGPIPKKGEFVKRWWISYGASIPRAQQLAQATHTRLRKSTNFTTVRPMPRLEYRTMTPINPEDIAACFRRVCLRDFAGIEDHYHTDIQRQKYERSVVYELAVRSNATMDTMEKEQRILASNFILIGHILNEFIVKLFNALEWTPQINQMMAATPDAIKAGRRVNGSSVHAHSWEASDTNLRRFTMVTLMAEQLLGPLDVVPTVHDLVEFNPDRSLPRTAASFFTYFQKMDPSEVLFFSPTLLSN